jgi:hypothetical protein
LDPLVTEVKTRKIEFDDSPTEDAQFLDAFDGMPERRTSDDNDEEPLLITY